MSSLIRPIVLIHGQPNVFLEALASTMDDHLAFRNAFKHNIISASSCSSDFCVDIVTLIAASMTLDADLRCRTVVSCHWLACAAERPAWFMLVRPFLNTLVLKLKPNGFLSR
ncbi:uncharacterized protein LOC111445823 [Cucurbita moschata]|uniref:Uncharacterized protein LOC111445823 n=1 Tax=Cucurbita moschata TaxID=3662 RepID=A0A6J1FHI6_CUCMO|nr:uncharacterized protein LOC111445823 [Cucurbita moschata]